MARNDGVDRTSVRNLAVSDKAVGNTQQHNEREKDSYRNPDIIPQRVAWNIHFKKPTASYTDLFAQLETAGTISTRGLKPDATHYCELVFDVNSAYFDNHGGYEFAKQFYEDAYKAAVQIVGGEQYILSAVMHADEINRATPKTQSALLEAMQEHTVTIGTTSHQLPEPFLVLATQNPIENEGTYPLPEAQLDRFLFKVLVKFPDRQELREIVELTEGNHPPKIEKVMDRESLLAARACVAQIPIADAVMDYILDLVMATHADNPYIREGASPRAAQALIRTARARAFMENRLNVSFEDVKCVALPVLRHRILLSFDAVSEGITEDAVIGQILTEKEQGLYA